MAVAGQTGIVALQSDLTGGEQQGTWSVTTSPTSIALPDGARIAVVIAPSADVIVRLNADPAAAGSNAFAAGSVVKSGTTRAYILADGAERALHVRSASGSATVTVEWRP